METRKSINIPENLPGFFETQFGPFRGEFWGRVGYPEALERQRQRVAERASGKIGDTLIFCEHDPIVTLGRGSQAQGGVDNPTNLFDKNGNVIPVLPVERGGLATLHAPGQLVVYPIVLVNPSRQLSEPSLSPLCRGVHGLIRGLETVLVDFLVELGIPAKTENGKTGVWVSKPHSLADRKIASIGVAVKKWVSFHGLSLNLKVEPYLWNLINPCGFSGNVMTDVFTESGKDHDLLGTAEKLLIKFNSFTRN